MENVEINAFQLDRLELFATQQLLKLALTHIFESSPDPRALREKFAADATFLAQRFDCRGVPDEHAPPMRDYMENVAMQLLAESRLRPAS